MTRLGSEPPISRSEVDCANHYSIGPLLENWQIYLYNIHYDGTKSELINGCSHVYKMIK
mgnify:FL=1